MSAFQFSLETWQRNGVGTAGWLLLGRCEDQQWECIPTWLEPDPGLHMRSRAGTGPQHCPAACTSLRPARAELRNSPSSSKGLCKTSAKGFGASLSPTLQSWGGTAAHYAAYLACAKQKALSCLSEEQCNPFAYLLSPSDHPLFPQPGNRKLEYCKSLEIAVDTLTVPGGTTRVKVIPLSRTVESDWFRFQRISRHHLKFNPRQDYLTV